MSRQKKKQKRSEWEESNGEIITCKQLLQCDVQCAEPDDLWICVRDTDGDVFSWSCECRTDYTARSTQSNNKKPTDIDSSADGAPKLPSNKVRQQLEARKSLKNLLNSEKSTTRFVGAVRNSARRENYILFFLLLDFPFLFHWGTSLSSEQLNDKPFFSPSKIYIKSTSFIHM